MLFTRHISPNMPQYAPHLSSLPVQVAAFLSPTYPAWDLTLMFVMGGALLVALPGVCSLVYLCIHGASIHTILCLPGSPLFVLAGPRV